MRYIIEALCEGEWVDWDLQVTKTFDEAVRAAASYLVLHPEDEHELRIRLGPLVFPITRG